MCTQEIHDALGSIESEAERLLAPERDHVTADAAERDKLYLRAEMVSRALIDLGAQLQTTVRTLHMPTHTDTHKHTHTHTHTPDAHGLP